MSEKKKDTLIKAIQNNNYEKTLIDYKGTIDEYNKKNYFQDSYLVDKEKTTYKEPDFSSKTWTELKINDSKRLIPKLDNPTLEEIQKELEHWTKQVSHTIGVDPILQGTDFTRKVKTRKFLSGKQKRFLYKVLHFCDKGALYLTNGQIKKIERIIKKNRYFTEDADFLNFLGELYKKKVINFDKNN